MFTSLLRITVDFVKQNRLVIGDSITLYEDECKNLVSSPSLLLSHSIISLQAKVGLKLTFEDHNALQPLLL